MTGIKQSNFTQVTSVSESDNIPLFTASENKRITYENMRNQLTDEIAVRFIYPTTAQLQQSNLEADEDEPNYVRCEETEYRLYKITALAAGADDIALDNGMTATYQEEYSKSGFVLGAASSTNNALALFDGTTGAQLKTGAVLSTIGGNLASATSIAQVSYPRVDAANAVTMATPTILKTDLNLPANTASSISAIEGDISTIEGDIVDINSDLATKVQTVETFAALATTPAPTAGMVVYLKQHTSGGLGGGHFQDTAGTITNNGGTLINNSVTSGRHWKRICDTPEIECEFFGALPSATDNKTSIEAAAAYVYSAGGGIITLGVGVYACSSLRLPVDIGTPFYAGKIVHLKGAGKNATQISITGSSGITFDTDNSDAAYGAIISDLRLLNSGTASDGIYIPFGCQFHVLDMTIQGFTNSGIKTTHDIWLSSVQRCHIGGNNIGAHGIQMLASGTSNYFNQIFVSQTTDYAYRLGGGYSTVGALAADDCGSGAAESTVYLFNGFTGSIGSLGAELNTAENLVHILNSHVSIGAFYFIANDVSPTLGSVLLTQGGSVKVDDITISDPTLPTVANKMFKSLSGRTIIGNVTSDVTYTTESGDSTSSSEFLQFNNRTSALAFRTGGSRAYVGYDRKGMGSTYLFGTVKSTAIFMDSLGSPLTTSDGVSRRYEVGAEIGDWFIESRPDLHHCAAYVARVSNSDLNAIDYTRIPIVLGGTTANRPTTRYGYMQYIDATLNKIIWWDGSNWRDAMGTVV